MPHNGKVSRSRGIRRLLALLIRFLDSIVDGTRLVSASCCSVLGDPPMRQLSSFFAIFITMLTLAGAGNPRRAHKALQVHRVLPVHRGPLVLPAHRGPLALAARRVRKGRLVRRVLPDLPAQRETPAQRRLCAS